MCYWCTACFVMVLDVTAQSSNCYCLLLQSSNAFTTIHYFVHHEFTIIIIYLYLLCHNGCLHEIEMKLAQPLKVFNRKTKLLQRDRTALAKDAHIYDYVRDHVARDVCDRVKDLKNSGKKWSILDLGSSCGLVAKHLDASRVESLIEYDSSANFLKRSKLSNSVLDKGFPVSYVQGDEETVDFADNQFDLVVSNLSLHWVNDLPSCFRKVSNIKI